ncbi:MAG: permease-like cell division protein FtsX [Paludibacter sp.]|jgi:cell division transport system permease protein|nr:permease-like cell division protein FtsX [Paludibacter sp.]
MPAKKKKKRFSAIHFSSVFSMSLVLLIIGLAALLLLTARDMSIYIRENISLRVELDDDIQDSYRKRIENYLTSAGFAKSIEYVSKDDALKAHIESLGEDPQKFLGYNPLKASLEIKLKAEYATTDSVKMIERKLKTFENIYRLDYPEDIVSFVSENVKKLTIVLFGITLLLLIISIALINNTIRLTVYSNRFIINTMKLVGATPGFIRKPYLLLGFKNGLLAALLALLMLAGVTYYIFEQFGISISTISYISATLVVLTVLGSGVFFTVLSSYFSVGKYLKMSGNDVFYA